MANWDVTKPADTDFFSQYPANERAARQAVVTNFGIDHQAVDGADIGKHLKVTLPVQTVDPAAAANQGVLYTKLVAAIAQLFYRSSDGVIIQLGAAGGGGGGGDVFLTANNVFTGNNTFNNDITMAGELVGFRGLPLISQTLNYTYVLSDAGKGRQKIGTTALIYTIPANASVAFAIGTILVAVNGAASATLTLAQGTGVTLRLAGGTTIGDRIIAPFGWATALKIATDQWLVSGPGVT